LTEHIHGGRVFEAARDLNIPWQRILDFSANINPAGQPKGLKAHLFAAFAETVHYPDVKAEGLVEAIRGSTGLAREAILPGAGSTPHIRLISRTLAPERPVIVAPAFAEYGEALEAAGRAPGYAFAEKRHGFEVTAEVAEAAIALNPDMIFIANPANPTGRLVPKASMEILLEHSLKTGCWLVIDEAFIGFTEGESLQALAAERERVIVLRSLTKIFAIPGLRLAYLVCAPESIRPLAAQTEPWPLNCMALEAGLFCIPQKEFVANTPADTARLRALLQMTLEPYGKVVRSDANFVLMDAGRQAPAIIRHLFANRILVRDCSNFKGLAHGFLRFAVRPRPE
jgi:threonine-phosphate decarboxylase